MYSVIIIELWLICRYGSPGNVTKDYNQFAEWYLKAFSGNAVISSIEFIIMKKNVRIKTPEVQSSTYNKTIN